MDSTLDTPLSSSNGGDKTKRILQLPFFSRSRHLFRCSSQSKVPVASRVEKGWNSLPALEKCLGLASASARASSLTLYTWL